MRHEADVQANGVDAQQPGEVGNLLHLLQPRARVSGGTRPDRPLDRGDVGIALARETAEDDGDLHAHVRHAGEEIAGTLRRAAGGLRGMKLDRRHAQLVGHAEMHAQTGVDAGKNS